VSARCGSSSITQAAVEERKKSAFLERFLETLNGQKKEEKALEKRATKSPSLSLSFETRAKKMAPPPSSSGGTPLIRRGLANSSDDGALFAARLAETEGSFASVVRRFWNLNVFP
jgi:hypothetical protein